MELSKRLSAVTAMVAPGSIVCDVGCDHGYVSIYLIETKKSPKVYAMDVRKGPLERAREHVQDYGYEEYIDLILSDGLKEMEPGIADTLICAGMGGRLVIKILSESLETVKQMKELVLQPQSEIRLVREFLRKQGFCLCGEDMVLEDGKFYPILHVNCRPNPDSKREQEKAGQEREDKYGPFLLKEKHPVLKEYLLWEKQQLIRIEKGLLHAGRDSEKAGQRQKALRAELEEIEEILQNCYNI